MKVRSLHVLLYYLCSSLILAVYIAPLIPQQPLSAGVPVSYP